MITANGYVITPTMFPDGTSQVWKIPDILLKIGVVQIQWDFEHEGELMHLIQLRWVLRTSQVHNRVSLHMPFLPYGRQDKDTGNKNCFARKCFYSVITSLDFDRITTIDAHSDCLPIISLYPGAAIVGAIENSKATAVCFPDKGASTRYSVDLRTIVLAKVREPSTGEIIGITVEKSDAPIASETSILIIDDICDGGRTFIEAAKVLKEHNPEVKIALYVSHGIFSKGTQVLRDAGITQIFTKDGLVV